LNTLSHFLDRFVYKNPKKPKPKGASAMQPGASASDGIGIKLLKGDSSGGTLPNDEKFLNRRLKDIPIDEVTIFWLFFATKTRAHMTLGLLPPILFEETRKGQEQSCRG